MNLYKIHFSWFVQELWSARNKKVWKEWKVNGRRDGYTKVEKKNVPQWAKACKEFTVGKHLHRKACGAIDTLDKSTRFTVCLHKTENTISIKNSDLPRSLWAGLCSSGFTELVYESIRKASFQRVRKSMRSFSLSDFKKTDFNIDSPADTCGCEVPKGSDCLAFHHHSYKSGKKSRVSI